MRRLFRVPWRSHRQIRADVDDELRFHLDMKVEELIALGLAPEAARREAMRQFGDLEDARRYIARTDRHTEAAQRRSDYMSELRHDLVYAVRKLRSSPGFAITAVLTLALGIGATTAIFSVVNGVLLQPLPFAQPDRLMRITFEDRGLPDVAAPNDLFDLRAQSRSFEGFSVIEGQTANLVANNGEPERLHGVGVSANHFDLLRVRPEVGRLFVPGEDTEGAAPVVVLSDALWRRRFNADPSIVGRDVRLNGVLRRVVGVVPAGQEYPISAELWVPRAFTLREQRDDMRGARWLSIVGRLKPGVSIETASKELAHNATEIEHRFPTQYRARRVIPVSALEFTVGDMRKPLFVILGAVAFVLLIACANVANLMLVRATAREGELAIRTALGAARSRLVRQLITESLVLAALGGVAGLLLARWGMAALLHLAPDDLPRLSNASIDLTALGVTALITLATGIVFGVLPSFQLARTELATTLRSGGRGVRDRISANRTKRAIVVAEVALAVTLLTGAGLLMRSFQELMRVEPGFRTDNVMTFRVTLTDARYDSAGRIPAFVNALEQRLRAIPGVSTAALSNGLPLDGNDMTISFHLRGDAPRATSEQRAAQVFTISPGFFATLGIPVERGRPFSSEDRTNAPRVAIVNRAFVAKHLKGRDPLSQYIELGWSVDGVKQGGRIVGVVGDVKQAGLADPAVPSVYLPFEQSDQPGLSIALRGSLTPAAMISSARAAVREVDRTLPIFAVRPLEALISSSVARQRFYALLLGVFAAVALTLAAVGLYGVISYAVSQRTHELGVRVALGASDQRITGMVMREGLALTGLGLALGLAGSVAVARIVASLLFGVRASDPITFGGVAVLLVGVAALASFLPARRAARVDPMVAMRGE